MKPTLFLTKSKDLEAVIALAILCAIAGLLIIGVGGCFI